MALPGVLIWSGKGRKVSRFSAQATRDSAVQGLREIENGKVGRAVQQGLALEGDRLTVDDMDPDAFGWGTGLDEHERAWLDHVLSLSAAGLPRAVRHSVPDWLDERLAALPGIALYAWMLKVGMIDRSIGDAGTER